MDELEEVVVSLFSGVSDKGVTVPEWLEHPFSGPTKKVSIVPVKDIRNLHITWPLPDLTKHYKAAVRAMPFR